MLWCATTRRQHQLPTTRLLIDGCSVTPVSTVRDLGIYIDSDLSIPSQVKDTVSRCYASLRGLRQIRRCVPPATLQIMMVALVHSRLDYGLPEAPTPVSPQCSCTTDFPSEIQRPYYRCAQQPSLVAGSTADPVQARCHGVQSATWTCTKLPRPLVRVTDVSGR